VLGVRHQPEHVPARIGDAGNVGDRAVRVLARCVAKCDLTVRLDLLEQVRVGEPAALAVLDGDGQALSRLAAAEERRRLLDEDIDVPADERERRVRAQRTREEPGLAEDLEAVADPEHRAALVREACDRSHRGSEARDRAAAQVVAVREAAREEDATDARELVLRVPHRDRLGAERAQRPERVAVVVRPGEDDDGDPRPVRRHGSRTSIS